MFDKGSIVKQRNGVLQAVVVWSNLRESRVVYIADGEDEILLTGELELVREPSGKLTDAVRELSLEELDRRLAALRATPKGSRKRASTGSAKKQLKLDAAELRTLLKMKAAGTLHPTLAAELDKALAASDEKGGNVG